VTTLLGEAGVAPDLTVAVETLTGTVPNRRSLASAVETAWDRVFAEAHDRWSDANQPLVTWLEELASQGLLKRLAAGDPARGSDPKSKNPSGSVTCYLPWICIELSRTK
jgi:hypothetical protein